ncbi:hypothetical protein D3C75_708590 [compost metagenome]
MPDKSNRLACLDIEVDAFQCRPALFIFKHYLIKFNVALNLRQRGCARFVLNSRLLIQILEDPFRGGHRHQQLVIHLPEPVDRVPEVADIRAERHQEPYRKFTGLNQVSPEPEQNHRPEAACNFDNRAKRLVHRRCLVPGFPAIHIHGVEIVHIFFFLSVRLGDSDPLNRLIQMGIDPRVLHPHILPGNPDLLAQLGGDKKHNRHGDHHRESQLPVDQQQNYHDSDQLHTVDHQIDDSVREQILQGVDIIGNPHQHGTRRPFIKKVEG